MTSEVETLKTNEFLRRRKLRLQQVREQSKDIAKKIRQRANVEKLKQFDDLDDKRRKDYLDNQDQLIKKLEELYNKGVDSVGESHKCASAKKNLDISPDKIDLSKQRGKEAAAELKRKRQEKLDEKKKLLDKRLQARVAANEISRDKTATIGSKKKGKNSEETQTKVSAEKESDKVKNPVSLQNDMATQWDYDEIPNEWEPNVPALSLPKDGKDAAKETNNNFESKSDKSRKIDLFALSEEMPSSLRGGLTNEERIPVKPSLTLVSEHLQSRSMGLRETTVPRPSNKKEDLQSLKETIQRFRTSKTKVSEKSNNIDKSVKSSTRESVLTKKNSVTQYNHSTSDTRDVPYSLDRLVVRDSENTEDAYSQAMKETSPPGSKEREHAKKLENMRSKVAMTKQNVEKEYQDTISFLNSLPKNKPCKGVTNAYMDENRQQMQQEIHQQKLQQEFKKIEKQCRKHSCTKNTRNKTKSPVRSNMADFNNKDFQYSWMPVPETDGHLTIHTVPTITKTAKSDNVVKFSTVDNYHEYRSRHKHTPPTKDTGNQEKTDKRIEAVIIQNISDSVDSNCSSTPESSADSVMLQKSKNAKDLSDAERIIIYKILDSSDKKTKKATLVRNIAKSKTLNDKTKGTPKNVQNESEHMARINRGDETLVPFEEIKEGIYKTVSEKGDNITSMYFAGNPDDEGKLVLNENKLKYGQPCSCTKQVHIQQQNDKGGGPQWENGDNTAGNTRTPSSYVGHKCDCSTTTKTEPQSKQALVLQPSTATSTSSFKTATNDKANNALPDGDFIKLVDEGGQEAGKFYIGTSGFLRDVGYEVVIQLRKKYGDKEDVVVDEKEVNLDKMSESNQSLGKVKEVTATAVLADKNETIVTQKTVDVNDPKNCGTGSQEENNGKILVKETTDSQKENQYNSSSNGNISMDKPSLQKANVAHEKPEYVDKGVYTSFPISYGNSDHVDKSSPVVRPATSTYTQTSLSSPNHRPIFFHMSSSTSTAYMSPPEMVLPNFLKHDYRVTDDEIYESIQNMNVNDKIVLDDQEYIEEYDSCRCKRCLHARKVTISKAKGSVRTKYEGAKLNPPPNTNRKTQDDIHKSSNHRIYKASSTGTNKINCKCRKHRSKTRLLSSPKSNSSKTHRPLFCGQRSSQHSVGPISASSSNKTKGFPSCDVRKLELNPIIKTYVDKLLALNKEGLKAIKVVEQDCSSVATPGSSIINVPQNSNESITKVEQKISLEQIKSMVKKQILEEIAKERSKIQDTDSVIPKFVVHKNVQVPRQPFKKTVHKVKSFNISKNLLKVKNKNHKKQISNINSVPFIPLKLISEKPILSSVTVPKMRSKSSPTPRNFNNSESVNRKISLDIEKKSKNTNKISKTNLLKPANIYKGSQAEKTCQKISSVLPPSNRATLTDASFKLSKIQGVAEENKNEKEINISTQTKENRDSDRNLIKVAEDKLQNMEKIADLTEKCSIRLSDLAKILDEVRKNKPLVYGQISTSDAASDSDHHSDKLATKSKTCLSENLYDMKTDTDNISPRKSPVSVSTFEKEVSPCATDYVPLLTDIPKPHSFTPITFNDQLSPLSFIHVDNSSIKKRGRPPPALSRINKHGQEIIVPHELSTVLEVDSPMSIKLKNASSHDKNSNDTNGSLINESIILSNKNNNMENTNNFEVKANPDLLQSSSNFSKPRAKLLFSDSSEDSKLQMMDMKQFNDIMLKPFMTFKEHAKQCNIVGVEEGSSNMDDIPKNDVPNDDFSSLHSDGSLPDVIAELLKRNIINEPFKYDTGSNVNSTTISSDSTLSLLALSKMRKRNKKTAVISNNKENETSDTLSASSNPDLEKAFKKLGMGWASSTLKRTKERLALSSSSNTSSSSLSQFKLKGFNNYEIPALVTDSLSAVLNVSKKPTKSRQTAEASRNAEQQTSKTQSMTVKEFLKNELANKITFTNPSRRDDTDEEFVSLFETKLPEQMKHVGQTIVEERTFDSVPSMKENRPRTSTPVQLFKSTTYHSSSSSNMSNGLFSNADELSSVRVTSNSVKNHSTSEKDDLAVPNLSLKMKKSLSECSKSD